MNKNDIIDIKLWQEMFCNDMKKALLGRMLQPHVVYRVCRWAKQLPAVVAQGNPLDIRVHKAPFTGYNDTDAYLPPFDRWVTHILEGNISDGDVLLIRRMGPKSLAQLKIGIRAWREWKQDNTTH